MDKNSGITVRAARPEDMPACVDLFIESVTDLARRHNYANFLPPAADRTLVFCRHSLATGVFHVAEKDGMLAAFSSAILRGHLWFLSGFWARPGMQQQHIGMQVLRPTWEAGKKAGCSHFFVWASSDLPALGAYMKLGMLPGSQILFFEGKPAALEVPAEYAAAPLDRAFGMTMDEIVLGTRREADHDLMHRIGWQGRQVSWNGRRIGYYYINQGSIGPAAWIDQAYAAPLLSLACREASAQAESVILRPCGMNHEAIRFAVGAGMRLMAFSHLLTTASFGHLDQYIPSGPAIF
jgi:hypothetical protein